MILMDQNINNQINNLQIQLKELTRLAKKTVNIIINYLGV